MSIKINFLQKLLGIVVVTALLFTWEAKDVFAENFEDAMMKFKEHYGERLGEVEGYLQPNKNGIKKQFIVKSAKLKGEGNYPKIWYHDRNTDNVIVLVHGLTDSPYYMEAIAKKFYSAGANVVLPLLPAHGLKFPDKAMEDDKLSEKWKTEIDKTVDIASMLGNRISVGGLSTGGALSVNVALRRPEKINGGLFLFSAALNIGTLNEFLGISKMLAPLVAKQKDGDYKGIGPNPYKYPLFTNFGGYQLVQIINENNSLKNRLSHPIFAAHSINDTAALIEGIVELFKNHGGNRNVLVISENPPVKHASVVLEDDIILNLANENAEKGAEQIVKANPKFKGMMDIAISFFNDYIDKN